MINVLLIEDEPMWQQGLKALLQTEPRIRLVGIVDNADDGEIFFEAEKPDVVLVDWKINGPRDGLELAKWLESRMPSERIILVTGSPQEQIPAHPYGYVPKSRIATELLPQILASMPEQAVPVL